MAGRPLEALAFERLPGIGVRLIRKNELQAVLCLIDIDLPTGECPADKLSLVAQLLNALAHTADVGVIVGEQIGWKRNGGFAPVLGHGRRDLFHLLRRQLGATLQRLVLAVVGIDRLHHGLLGLHPLQFFCELFHSKVIVGADTAPACGADLVQQLFNFRVLAVVAIPGGVLLGLFRHREIAAPGNQNGRHTDVNGVALIEVFRQPAGVAVNKGIDLIMVHGIDLRLLFLCQRVGFIHHRPVDRCGRAGGIVGIAVHVLCPLCCRLADLIIFRHNSSSQPGLRDKMSQSPGAWMWKAFF